ncbi:helix-turn-helix domain-containing protein [Streptomyces sp. LE64]|uniref:helix-turn-helix domain-containing protein n=1 Tax=Streptomyces sp. LE64 TaxID=3448653 RepID=UPI0040415842
MIQLVRRDARVSQRQLGDFCGLSQSAVSRIEQRGSGAYDMKTLARVAEYLSIPPSLVGLAETGSRPSPPTEDRESLGSRSRLAAVHEDATVSELHGSLPRISGAGPDQAHVLSIATHSFRKVEATVAASQLLDAVQGHMRLVRAVTAQETDREGRARMAAVGSEVASFAGWLCWDMSDQGSARSWYGAAIKAAKRSHRPLLTAYQQGSLAQFEVELGNVAQGLQLISAAREQLSGDYPAISAAWLSSLEAVAHATAGNSREADRALLDSEIRTREVSRDEMPPWPWIFTFDQRKVAAARVTCGARLARARWVEESLDDARAALTAGHQKQRALLGLDVASGYLSSGQLDSAFALALRSLDVGVRLRSGRIVERARAFRRAYASTSPPSVVREFDAQLHDVYL